MRVSVNNSVVASQKELEEFRGALEELGLKLSQFCEIVAVEEGDGNSDLEDNIKNNVKRYLNRGLKKRRLKQFWTYLSAQPNFEKAGRVVLPSSSEYLKKSKYSSVIMSTFDT